METMEKRQTLVEISKDFMKFDATLDDLDGNIEDPTLQAALSTWFNTIEDDMNRKVDDYTAYIRHLELCVAARREESERLMKRVHTDENTCKFLKDRLKETFESLGIKKAGIKRTAAVQANGGLLPLEVAGNIPDAFMYQPPPEIDNGAIREALKQNVELSFAKLGERGTHLRIR